MSRYPALDTLPERVRAFVALRLAPEVERAIAELVEELRPFGPGVSWLRPANLHLTLRFLGAAVPSVMLPPLAMGLAELASAAGPFSVVARGIGAFPNLAHPRVLWIGLEGDELVRLAARVEAATQAAGLGPETRSYSPHLTIGRVKSLRGWSQMRDALEHVLDRSFGVSLIDTLTLYRSILTPEHATYQALALFPLGSTKASEV